MTDTALPLSAYAREIELYLPFKPHFEHNGVTAVIKNEKELYTLILEFLLTEEDMRHYLAAYTGIKSALNQAILPQNEQEQRTLIQALLTLRPPRPFTPEIWQALDTLFYSEAANRKVTDVNALFSEATKFNNSTQSTNLNIALWRGDITTLNAHAIVNAANSAMLGCFEPFHRCIDNAIHSAAGPRLRDDCGIIMNLQNHLEPTGTAKITRAYALPSRFVLHTVGPIVPNHKPSAIAQKQLAACYTACLECCATASTELVKNNQPPIQSIAFCCVSTGIFGYPQEQAAPLAIKTVKNWLQNNSYKPNIIFNVFSENDECVYKQYL
ncbi:protein-ADP-ribose hydrolase [Desulfovibrio sp. OttesenSCG-928-F07]|nr:protein-ADP-ribose hydrolase [Desulfovibrio sp. OttesenSCG-928-F07]